LAIIKTAPSTNNNAEVTRISQHWEYLIHSAIFIYSQNKRVKLVIIKDRIEYKRKVTILI